MNRVTVAITGASGAIYGLRTLRALLMNGDRVDLIVSDWGWMILREEAGFEGKQSEFGDFMVDQYGEAIQKGELTLHPFGNLAASISSGSVHAGGMVVVPCSMGTVGRLAAGISSTLIEHCADVALKERRPLVLVPRETPLSTLHLRNLLTLSEVGARIVPAMPAFYTRPKNLEDVIGFVVDRAIQSADLGLPLRQVWRGQGS